MDFKIVVIFALLHFCAGSGHRQYFGKYEGQESIGKFGKNGRLNGRVLHYEPCADGACYPPTGNLLIGREGKLTVSSTSGLQNHGIEKIINRYEPKTNTRNWWQSENGVENVSIRLDLEAQFHFTHLIMTFKSVRPAAMLIERSNDEGKTWQVYRYFAADCDTAFPGVSKVQTGVSDVICESRYSAISPRTDAEVIFRVLPPSVRHVQDPNTDEMQKLLTITNLRVNFTKFHDIGEPKETQFYALYDMTVRGSCSCNGHASKCIPLKWSETKNYPSHMVHPRCACAHNTKGLNCQMCKDLYNDLP